MSSETASPAIDLTDPASFPHWVDEHVRFCDTDAGGHINNTSYAAYIESGRVAFSRAIIRERAPGSRWVVARIAIDYRAEGFYPSDLKVGTRVLRIGKSSFTIGHGVFAAGKCLATGESVTVHVGGKQGAPMPAGVREALEQVMKGRKPA